MKRKLIILFLFTVSFLSAQITTSTLSGTIKNSSNQKLEGAKITLLYTPTNESSLTTTDKKGNYSFNNLTPGGSYVLKVIMSNYETLEVVNLNLQIGGNDFFDYSLKNGANTLDEVVIKTSKPKVISSFSEKQIANQPTISRSITDITKNVAQNNNNSFAGTNFRYNNVTVDGAISNDAIGFSPSLGGQTGTSGMPGSSTRSTSISLDAIQDVQVYLAPFDVKIGNFLGGSINAVTRSGTNEFTGSVYAYGRNATITGKNRIEDNSKMPKSFYEIQNGVRLGFPIVKDKVFFFTNFEVAYRKDPVFYGANETNAQGKSIALINESDALKLSNFMKNKYGYNIGDYNNYNNYAQSAKTFNKLDWKINNNHHLSIRNSYSLSEASNLDRDATNFRFGSMDYIQKNETNGTVIDFKSKFNSNFNNNLTLGASFIKDYRVPTSQDLTKPQLEIGYNGGTIFIGNDREASVFNMKQKTYEFTDNLTWKKRNHTFLLGTHNEFYSIDYGFVNSPNGRISYSSLDKFYAATPSRVRGTYALNTNGAYDSEHNNTNYLFNNPYAKFNVNLYSAYIQDEIKIGSRLKISPGLRVDLADVPKSPPLNDLVKNSPEDPNYGTTYSYTPLNKINNKLFGKPVLSPRVGFNYNVLGDNKFILRGGTGVFTGRIPFAWLGYAYYNDGVGFGGYDDKMSIAHTGDPISDGAYNYYSTNNTNASKQIQVDLVDNNFKMPRAWRSNLATDLNIKGYKFTLDGLYTKVIYDLKFQQVNLKDANKDDVKYYSYDTENQMPIYSGAKINNKFSNAYMLSNTDQGYRYNITTQVSKNYDFGINFMIAYTYGESKDITNGIRNSMESNWQLNQSLTPNDPKLAYSNFDIRHRIVSNLGYNKSWGKYNLAISAFFSSHSGTPYTWGLVNSTINGTGQAAGLAYIPKDVNEMQKYLINNSSTGELATDQAKNFDNFVSSNKYLNSRRGNFTERNGDRTPWSSQLDIRLLHTLKLNKKQNVQLTMDFINVTNLINKNWGVSYFASNTFNSTSSVGLTPTGKLNSNGDPTYTYSTPKNASYSIDQFASRFQGQIGLRYSF